VKKVKISKTERKLKYLRSLLERRSREIEGIRDRADFEIEKVRRRNRYTEFQIASIEKGEWPL
jgi:hypothetical protein